MSRLPAIDRDKLAPDDQAVYDRIRARRGGGPMRGPSSVLMYTPALADRVIAVEDYFRSQAELPAVDQELVILTTAREMEARFPWARHEARAHQVGTRDEAIEAVRTVGPLEGLTSRERVLVEVVRTLLRNHALPDDLFARALKELGRTQLVETVGLVGNYCLVGPVATGFDIPEESQTF